MATRINTKFVITLVSVLVLTVLGLLFAFIFLKKSAQDHINLAEAAMVRASSAIEKGDVEEHNSELKRASKHFGSAKDKDASNIESLYGFIESHQKYICSNLTTAGNEYNSIIAGASSLHDTPGASDEDREFLYKFLHKQARMAQFSSNRNPIGSIISFTTKRLDVAPEDTVALRYQALAISYLAEQRTKAEEVTEDLQKLDAAAQANPKNPWLQNALAKYHLGNARRIFRTKGNTFTADVNASFALAFKHVQSAQQLAKDNLPAYVEAAVILADIRSNNDALAKEIGNQQTQTAISLDQLLADKDNRQSLFVEELINAIQIIRRTRPALDADPPQTFDGRAQSFALAEQLPKDRPNEPKAYEVLANLQREINRLDDAIETLEGGLAAERLTNATDYIRDHMARLDLKSVLADLTCTKALRSSDPAERTKLLDKANAMTKELAGADTNDPERLNARVDFLSGRIALAQNKPQLAVTLLEDANKAYGNKDAQTLRLLAQTHARLNNDAMVRRYYETIAFKLRPNAQDLLNLINHYLNPGENQQLDKAQALLDNFQKQAPKEIGGIRLRARLLQERDQIPEAIALLSEQDLDKYPEVQNQIATLQGISGDTQGVINLLRDRLAKTPEGEKINLQAVTQLLNLLPKAEEKKAELKRLVDLGLEKKIADILDRIFTSGAPKIEDELALVDLTQDDPTDVAMQKYLVYRRWNQVEEGRPLLDKAIELSPNKPTVIEWRYKMALEEKRWDDAQLAIRDMLSLDPNERTGIAIADGRFMRSQVLALQAASMDPGETRNKRIREAVAAYNRALDQYSHYVEGWIQLARLHLDQGNVFAAQDSLQEALKRQSKNVLAIELLAISQARSDDKINAMENFEKVLEIQPNHPTALDQFTALATQMGLATRAVQLREQIIERSPGNYNNRRALALLYAQNKAFSDAKKTIQAVIEAEGTTLQNTAVKAQILSTNEENDQAIKTVTDYLVAQGEEAAWRDHLLLAQTYEQAKQAGLADQAFSKAMELEKSDGTLFSAVSFGQARINRGQVPQAAELFEGLIDDFPENQPLKQRSAELYLQLGEFEKAETIANRMPASANRDRLLVQSAARQNGKLGLAIQRAEKAAKAYPSDFGLGLILIELLQTDQDRKTVDKRDYDKVLAKAKALTQDHPDQVDAKVVLADVLLRMNRIAEATAELDKALSFAPRHLNANDRLFRIKLSEAGELAGSNPEKSLEKAQEALAIASMLNEARPKNAALLRAAGQAARLAGLPGQAIDFYRGSFEASPSAETLATYANALLGANQGANARAVLEDPAHATLISDNLYMRALRGRAIAAAGQREKATTLFGNLLDQNKEPNPQMIIAQQIAMTFASEPDRAINLFESKLGKDLPDLIEDVIAKILIDRREYEKAVQRLSKYLDQPAADMKLQFSMLTQLALAQQESGKLIDAKATYKRVYNAMKANEGVATRMGRVKLLNNMAYLYADQLQGYEKDAVQYAEQALALMSDQDPAQQYALIQDTVGWAYHKAGKNEDAIRVLKQSVARAPLVANQLHLGQVYLAIGDKDSALLVLEDAMNLARSQNDEKMIAETQKWYRKAI